MTVILRTYLTPGVASSMSLALHVTTTVVVFTFLSTIVLVGAILR